jgi:hypothetical protein
MGETTDQVRAEADQARERLVHDLNRLEDRVETLSDWHTWFQRYPWGFVGAAFAGAFLLGWLVTPRRAWAPR